MALDLTALSRQVRQMSSSLAAKVSETSQRTETITEYYVNQSGAEDHWRQAVHLSNDTAAWLLAAPVEPLDTVRDVPTTPRSYALAASDGSQIDIDRHGVVSCYLINTGRVYLRYGDTPAARLSSHPMLYYQEDDLYLTDGAKRVAIEGTYLNARRDVEELHAVAALAEELLTDDDAIPTLALQDGTLIRWTLAAADKFVQQHFLRAYFNGLERLRARNIPVAAYISRPRTLEIVGTIRLMYCPDVDVAGQRGAKCTVCSDVLASRPPSCSLCHGLTDADVLAGRLTEGQRGPLFASMNPINIKAYGEHLIHFFYLRVGREMARVEVPRWVAEQPELLNRVHSLIYDQCARGQGYPVALARAHEQAVVRTADRRTFQRVVAGSLMRAELPATSSRKSESKERSAL